MHGKCCYLYCGRHGMLFMLVFLFPSISWRNTTIMDKNLMTQFYLWGFLNSHKPSPSPTLQTTLDACIHNFFRVSYSTVPRTFVQDCRFHFGLRKKARWRAMRVDTGNRNAVLANKINSNYSPQWIPLAIDTEVNNCFSIY